MSLVHVAASEKPPLVSTRGQPRAPDDHRRTDAQGRSGVNRVHGTPIGRGVHTAPGGRPRRVPSGPCPRPRRLCVRSRGIVVAAVAVGARGVLPRQTRHGAAGRVARRTGITAHAKDVRTVPDVAPQHAAATASRDRVDARATSTARAFGRPVASDELDVAAARAGAARARPVHAGRGRRAEGSRRASSTSATSSSRPARSTSRGVVAFAGERPARRAARGRLRRRRDAGRRHGTGRPRPSDAERSACAGRASGWLVRSFDLRLATRPQPTPHRRRV